MLIYFIDTTVVIMCKRKHVLVLITVNIEDKFGNH
jgi:hypothetical protein